MPNAVTYRRWTWAALGSWVLSGVLARAEDPVQPIPEKPASALPQEVPATPPGSRPLPITLPAALQLAGTSPLDIAVARERVRVACAQLERANVLWLPTLYLGVDYARHDGHLQDIEGNILGTSRQSLLVGAGPSAVFAVTDAVYGPLAARQVVRARRAGVEAAANDSLLSVAEAYFNVQQARGELAGAEDAARRAEELVRKATDLAPGLAPPVEVSRARTELARRRQAVHAGRERWRTASAELVRILRLDQGALVEPQEAPHLRVTLVGPEKSVDELIPVGLTNRPELAAQQALVQATLERLRQEKIRPLVPSILFRGNATNPGGTLATGIFGGGQNNQMANFSARADFDIQVLWELQNLGFGNRARVQERRAENQVALLELFRTQDRVAAEVTQAHAQAQAAAARVEEAEAEVAAAVDSAQKNFEGLGQTRRVGNLNLLVIRPAEAVAAVQALALAYAGYYAAVGDFNRAQFRLYRALGRPAHLVTRELDRPVQP